MSERAVPDWLTRTIFAHRGLHTTDVPENSLAAAKAAEERGLGIECDIQMSADGVPFVFHDWDLERLTGGTGLVESLSAAELGQERLKGTQEHPTPLEVFVAALNPATPLLIEIKSKPGLEIEPRCAAIAEVLTDLDRPLAVMSFDPRIPAWFADRAPHLCRGLVGTDSLPNGFEHVWRDPDTISLAQPDFLALDCRDLRQAEAQAWRAQGKPLLSWTIRTAQDRAETLPLADALIAEGEALA